MKFKKIILISLICFCFLSCTKSNSIANLPPDSSQNNEQKHFHKKPAENPPVPLPLNSTPANGANGGMPSQAIPNVPLATTSVTLPAQAGTLKENENVNLKSLTGTVMGIQTSQLSFQVNGYVSDVYVKNGQLVKKGQAIAKLDNSITLQQLNLSKIALDQAQVTEHYAQLTLKRTQTLNERQATTQIALEQAESAYKNAVLSVQQAQANLKLSQINYDNTTLHAPYEGALFNISTWIGNYVSSTNPIASITSLKDLQIQIPVPQTVANKFTVGQVFQFSNSSQKIGGSLKVTGIVPYVDASSKTYMLYAVPLSVHGQLMAGELIIVDIK